MRMSYVVKVIKRSTTRALCFLIERLGRCRLKNSVMISFLTWEAIVI